MLVGGILRQIKERRRGVAIHRLIKVFFNVCFQRRLETNIVQHMDTVVYLVAVSLHLLVAGRRITVAQRLAAIRIVKKLRSAPRVTEVVFRTGAEPSGEFFAVNKEFLIAFTPPDTVDDLIDVQARAHIAAFSLNGKHLRIRCTVVGAGKTALPVGMETGQRIYLLIRQLLRAVSRRDRPCRIGAVGQRDLRGVEGHIPFGIHDPFVAQAVSRVVKALVIEAVMDAKEIRHWHTDRRGIGAIPVHPDRPVRQGFLLVQLISRNVELQRGSADRSGRSLFKKRHSLAGLDLAVKAGRTIGDGFIRQNGVGFLKCLTVFFGHRPCE